MRHRKNTSKLGRTGAHKRALLSNQVASLILVGQIKTTVQKAKETRRLAEKMVTLAKKGDLHHRRLAVSKIKNNDAVKILFGDIAPKLAERKGGYTRILKLGKRIGDNAELAILKWVDEVAPPVEKTPKKKTEKKPAEKETKSAESK
jgi:large subunit ribosomal protein L17